MSGLLYFLPEQTGCMPEDLSRFGLSEIFKDASPDRIGCDGGPDGRPGVIIRVGGREPIPGAKKAKIGYFPQRQEWEKVGDTNNTNEKHESHEAASRRSQGGKEEEETQVSGAGGRPSYWIGYEKESPPAPLDLQRPELIGGHMVKLEGVGDSDGDEWLVPVARIFGGGTMLPERLRIGPDNEWVSEVLPRFAEFSRVAESLWGEFMQGVESSDGEDAEDAPEPMSVGEKCRISAMALAINYRVGEAELSALGALSTENVSKILAAIVDVKGLVEMMQDHLAANASSPEKKSDGAGSDISITSDGEQAK